MLKKMLSERKSFRRFKKREPSLTREQKIEQFILRNSQNGYSLALITATLSARLNVKVVQQMAGF